VTRFSLARRLTVIWVLLAAALMVLLGYVSYRGLREQVRTTWTQTLAHEGKMASLRVQAALDEAVRDATHLANLPSVAKSRSG
jgi:hypothetical protein